jgi:hypothetical protein
VTQLCFPFSALCLKDTAAVKRKISVRLVREKWEDNAYAVARVTCGGSLYRAARHPPSFYLDNGPPSYYSLYTYSRLNFINRRQEPRSQRRSSSFVGLDQEVWSTSDRATTLDPSQDEVTGLVRSCGSAYSKALEHEYRVKTVVLDILKRYSIISLTLYLE